MKKLVSSLFLPVLLSIAFISCADLEREVDKRIQDLQKQVESWGTLITREAGVAIDSVANKAGDKAQQLDSIAKESATKLDSIVTDVITPPIE